MSSSKAVDEAIRCVSRELANKEDNKIVVGETPEERSVLQKYARAGTRNATIGFLLGAGTLTGVWRMTGGKRRLLGAMVAATGGIVGMSYGILNIRQELFAELLSLPEEKSTFAAKSRRILEENLPNNTFYREIQARMRANPSYSTEEVVAEESWNESVPPAQKKQDTPTLPRPVGSTNSSSSKPIQSSSSSTIVQEPSKSPFFYDYPQDSGSRPVNKPVSQQDEEEQAYFFGYPPGSMASSSPSSTTPTPPPPTTTWEEIRRRRHQQK